jgi:transaldolase
MKIFLDTANIDAISRANDTGLLDGVTTNPTKILETGKPFTNVLEEICSVVSGPVSAEGVAEQAEDIVAEALKVTPIAPNIAIKVPMTAEGLKACKILRGKDIMVNATMIFAPDQALLAMKAGASFASIVLSRLDKIAGDVASFVDDTVRIKRNYGFKSEILAASVKTRQDVIHCMRAGVDIVTVSESIFFDMFKHPLTDKGLNEFDKDWEKVKSAGLI